MGCRLHPAMVAKSLDETFCDIRNAMQVLLLCAWFAQIQLNLKPAAPSPASPPSPQRQIVVEAGKFDRQSTVVQVNLDAPADAKMALRDPHGRTLPLQVTGGRAAFLVEGLKAGTSATYTVIDTPKKAPPARVTIDGANPAIIGVKLDGKPVLQYEGRATTEPRTDVPANLIRSGFIHPVFSPAGAVLTEAYPEEQSRHLGLWSYWQYAKAGGKVADLWNKPGETGRVYMESKGPTWEGPVHGGFESRQLFAGLKAFDGKTLLRESWKVTVYAGRPGRQPYLLFDLETEQTSPPDMAVEVPQSNFGGLAFRGRSEWTKPEGRLRRLLSETGTTRARWAFLGGQMRGKTAGLAILGDPANLGAPQAVADTGTQPVINLVPNKDKAIKIEPGAPYRARYRFVALDGQPDAKLLERLWNDFAFPPTAKVTVVQRPVGKKTASQP